MIRSPIFKDKPLGLWGWTEGRMQIPIGAAAFILALLLVTAAAALAGGVLGVALPVRIMDPPRVGSANGRTDPRSIGTMDITQDANGNGWEQAGLHQARRRTTE